MGAPASTSKYPLPDSMTLPAATLGDLAGGSAPRTLSTDDVGLHWAATAPARIAACARELIVSGTDPSAEARGYLVPGRIEVLGKHTDYAGGTSLVAAVERGFVVIATPRHDGCVRITSLNAAETAEFALDPELPRGAGWHLYPRTVARRIARDFPGACPGADIVVESDLPLAAGMSSSSALLVGTFLALAGAGGLAADPRFTGAIADGVALATYLAAVESGLPFAGLAGDSGVGTHGGSEDHTAILNARRGGLLRCRFIPTRLEQTLEIPAGYCFALACSGVTAEKTGAMMERYNRAAALVRALLSIRGEVEGAPAASLAAALDSDSGALDRLRRAVRQSAHSLFEPSDLLARLEHFVRESTIIVPAASAALAEGRLPEFGEAVDESQRMAERLLGNQIPETIELARAARHLGAAAASAFGAGCGGSVWALVREDDAHSFLREWQRAYDTAFPAPAQRATFFSSAPGPSATRVV